DEAAQEALLPGKHLVRVVARRGEGEEGWRPERAESSEELVILRLRLVDQYVDADPARMHRVDLAQRPGEQSAIERRALAELRQRVVVVGDERDALVLAECPLGPRGEAQVVERALGIAGEVD